MKEDPTKPTSKSPLPWLKIPKIKSKGLKRTIVGLSLLAYMGLAVYVGPPLILFSTLIIQIQCFDEVINIAYNIKKIPDIPYFRTLNWYFLVVANYFFAGETITHHMDAIIKKYYFLQFVVAYHRFICFCFYFAGMIWFLKLIRANVIRQQFSLLCWTHFLIMIIALQSYMIVENLFNGMIWVILPLSLVILNDVFAYVFGRFFGKTPLISLSPKKTLEGFVLGGISTVVLGVLLAYFFCLFQYLVCPIRYIETQGGIKVSTNCTRNYVFQPQPYPIGNTGLHVNFYPFLKHYLALSIFASIIAPFGGFCASGFKRAVKVKDFGDIIPGHGGFMDRFDCQYLMATFINVYITTFIRSTDVQRIYQKVLYLSDEKQLQFFHLLEDSLQNSGLINR